MIKFRGKESDIDQTYNLLKIALKGMEWNVNIENIKKHIKLSNIIHFLSKFGSGMNFFK